MTIYHFGIIDYLQIWNFSKNMESIFKAIKGNKNNQDFSAVDPVKYKKRFDEKILYKYMDAGKIMNSNNLERLSVFFSEKQEDLLFGGFNQS